MVRNPARTRWGAARRGVRFLRSPLRKVARVDKWTRLLTGRPGFGLARGFESHTFRYLIQPFAFQRSYCFGCSTIGSVGRNSCGSVAASRSASISRAYDHGAASATDERQ